MAAQGGHQHAIAGGGKVFGIGDELQAAGGEAVAEYDGFAIGGAKGAIARPKPVGGAIGMGLAAVYLMHRQPPQALPIKMPAAKTSDPPSTTCMTARQNGACM